MAAIIPCPSCGGAVRIPDRLMGSSIKLACPHCRKVIGNAGQLSPPTAPPEASPPQKPSRPPRRAARPPVAPPPVRKPGPPARPPDELPVAEFLPEEPALNRPEPDEVADAIPGEGYEIVADEPKPSRPSRRTETGQGQSRRLAPGLSEPVRRRKPGSLAAWDKMRLGFKLLCMAILIAMGAGLLSCCIGFIGTCGLTSGATFEISSEGPAATTLGFAAIVLLIIQIVVLGAFVLYLTGLTLCVFAPPEHGTKALAITTLGLNVLCVFLSISGMIAGLFHVGSIASPIQPFSDLLGSMIGCVGSLTWVAGFILFILLERAIGVCLRADDLVRSTHAMLLLIGGVFVASLFVQMILWATAAQTVSMGLAGLRGIQGLFTFAGVAYCFLLILALIIGFCYIALIFKTHAVLCDHVNRLD